MAQGPPELGDPVAPPVAAVRSAGSAVVEVSRTADEGRRLPPPIVTDFASEDGQKTVKGKGKEREVPLSPKTVVPKEPQSPRKPHQRYKHHEPAPRRLLRRLNTLFHPNSHADQSKHKHSHSLPSSLGTSSASLVRTTSATSARQPRVHATSPLVAEPESMPISSAPSPSSIPTAPALEAVRPSIKIRICTFNMHDSLPSSDGDLADFLGDVDEFPGEFARKPKKRMSSHGSFGAKSSSKGSVVNVALNPEDVQTALPKFPLDAGHPYHILVVCGQECPTASGVLAGKVRTLDGKGWTSRLENYLCGGCSRDGYGSDSDSESSSPSDAGTTGGNGTAPSIHIETDDGESPPLHTESDAPPPPPSAANGGTGYDSSNPPSAAPMRPGGSSVSARSGSGSRSGSALGGNRRTRPRGPYVLVEKERLMGIYIAVFVARCCEDLVEGVSKGKVTAGLIGGRLGNKGGVGISLHFASSRLLFISAHLAAHASGLEIRKANALKIFEELDVDDFWEASGKVGPKPKELTERFDQTFFAADANFRLNVSRLHADWLVRGKDYATMLKFDQLREVLADPNSVFKGFSEGDITFPPTYKLDVPHKVKKRRSTILGKRSSRSSKRNSRNLPPPSPSFGFTPPDADIISLSGSITDPEITHSAAREDDSLSIISSVGSISGCSALDLDPVSIPRADLKADLSTLGLPPPPLNHKGNETSMSEVRKAQVRFLTLVKSNSAAAAVQRAQSNARRTEAGEGRRSGPSTPKLSSLFPPRPILQTSQSALAFPPSAPESETEDVHARRERTGNTTEPEGLGEKVFEAVFDSSAKQRVQSWTDRVLFKSTVVPPPPSEIEEEEEPAVEEQPATFDIRSRRSTNFAAALRNLAHHSSSSSDSEGEEPERGRRPTSADGSRRLRFGETFSRPRLSRRSTDSVATPQDERPRSSSRGRPAVLRAKSLQQVSPGRRASNASEGSVELNQPSFWKRVRSLKDLTSLPTSHSPTRGSAPASLHSPLDSPALSSATTSTPVAPLPLTAASPQLGSPTSTSVPPFLRRTPRKKFTLTSPPSSPEDSRPSSPAASIHPPFSRRASAVQLDADHPSSSTPPPASPHISFPRSSTFSAAVSSHAFHRRDNSSSVLSTHGGASNPRSGHAHSASTATLNTRFKSFFNLLPLPFLSSTHRSLGAEVARGLEDADGRKKQKVVKTGPRKGEIEVLKYDSVMDLAKMGCFSDHRPVVAVLAVGVGEPEEEEKS